AACPRLNASTYCSYVLTGFGAQGVCSTMVPSRRASFCAATPQVHSNKMATMSKHRAFLMPVALVMLRSAAQRLALGWRHHPHLDSGTLVGLPDGCSIAPHRSPV